MSQVVPIYALTVGELAILVTTIVIIILIVKAK
jgi:hypothetical protein